MGGDTWAGFDAELPSEWESWLRHRRADPPAEREVMPDLEKGVDPGILDPRKYLGCKKVFSPNPALLSKI